MKNRPQLASFLWRLVSCKQGQLVTLKKNVIFFSISLFRHLTSVSKAISSTTLKIIYDNSKKNII